MWIINLINHAGLLAAVGNGFGSGQQSGHKKFGPIYQSNILIRFNEINFKKKTFTFKLFLICQ